MSTSRQTGRSRKSSTASRPAAPATSPEAAPAPVVSASGNAPWVHDYDYVLKDLRKLAIVSLSLFAIIVVAGFFF